MREIIFRAWWKDDNTLVDPKSYVICPDGTIEFPEGGWDLQGWDSSDLVILEQYTRLTDKNGKRIFEGDIVSYEDVVGIEDGIGNVLFDLFNGAWIVFVNDYEENLLADVAYNCEIIGSIHDQKEDV